MGSCVVVTCTGLHFGCDWMAWQKGGEKGSLPQLMDSKFVGRVRRSDILRAITLLALLACILTIGVSAGWLYAPTAITIEKLERGFESTRHSIQNSESSEIHHAAAETKPISTGSINERNKRRRPTTGGALLLILYSLILFMTTWSGSRWELLRLFPLHRLGDNRPAAMTARTSRNTRPQRFTDDPRPTSPPTSRILVGM